MILKMVFRGRRRATREWEAERGLFLDLICRQITFREVFPPPILSLHSVGY
jgi:hypothetical protein